jgi:hypothetical protein
MKRNRLLLVGVLAFTVLVAGVAFAHVNQDSWCTGDSGWRDTMNSHMGNTMGPGMGYMMGPDYGRMGSYAEHMGSGHMGPYEDHMGSSSPSHMTARHDGKNGDFDCPGWDTGRKSKDTGSKSNETGRRDTGRKGEESK